MSEKIVTAAVLVIGDEILSGRTKDRNIGYIAEYLANIGVDLREARVVPDVEEEIVAALNALRARYDYVFTTGGIGPTHDDITADAVAKAFGAPIDEDPRALALMRARYKTDELNAARRRMARMPVGAELVDNPVSPPPGFRIGNVIVMAGVPAVMQAMLDTAAKTIETGTKMTVQTIDAGAIPGGALRRSARRHRRRPWRDDHRLLSLLRRRLVPQPDRRARPRSGQGRGDAGGGRGDAGRDPRRRQAGLRAGRGGKAVDGGRRASRAAAPLANQGAASGTRTSAMADGREKAFPVSWDQFHRDARALAWRLSAAGPFEAIVAVTRGGLVPAAIVARELELRVIETVCVASYHNYKDQGGIKVLKSIGAERRQVGRRRDVLLLDDLVDTGATAKVVREMLPKAHFATVYAKPLGRPLVDTFITEVSQDTWIYFPWDMGLAFQPPIAKDAAG